VIRLNRPVERNGQRPTLVAGERDGSRGGEVA
jgi:hypothetical protein